MKRNHGLVRSEVYTVAKDRSDPGVEDVSALVSDTIDQAFYANEGTWPEGFEITGFTIFLEEQYGATWATQDVPLGDQDTMTGGSPIRYGGDIYQNAKQLLRVYYKGSMSNPAATVGPTIYYKFELGQVTLGELINHTQLTGSLQGQHNKTAGLVVDNTNTVGFFDIELDLRFTGRTSDTLFNLDFYSSNDFSTPADRLQGIGLRIKGIEFEFAIERTAHDYDGLNTAPEFIVAPSTQYQLDEGATYRHKFRIKNAKNKGLTGTDIPIAWFEDPAVTGVTRTADLSSPFYADVQHSGTTAGWPTAGVNFTTSDNMPNTSYNPSRSYLDTDGITNRPMSEKWLTAKYWPDVASEGSEYFAPIMKAYYQDPDEISPSWHTIQWNSFEIRDLSTSNQLPYSTSFPSSVTEGGYYVFSSTFLDPDNMRSPVYGQIVLNGTASSSDFITPTNTRQLLNGSRAYDSSLNQYTRQYNFVVEPADDVLSTESTETFQVRFERQRPDGTYYTVAYRDPVNLINVAPDPMSELVGVPLNVYYNTVSSDYTGAYDRYEIPVNNSTASYKRLYFGIKIGTSTTFYNDVCVAGIAVLNSSGTVTHYDVFNSTSNQGWETTLSNITYTATSKPSLSLVGGYTYSPISTSNSTTRIGLATSTGSSNTGMADGIASGSTSFTQSSSLVSQSSGSYYLYREASGSTRYSFAFARRASSILIPTNATIRIIAKFTTNSGMNGTFDPNDILFVGLY